MQTRSDESVENDDLNWILRSIGTWKMTDGEMIDIERRCSVKR